MVFVGAVALPFAHTPAGISHEGRYPRLSGLGSEVQSLVATRSRRPYQKAIVVLL